LGTAAAAGRTVPDGFGGSFFSSKLLEVSEGGGWRVGGWGGRGGVEGKGGGGGGWQGRKWTLKWSSRRLSSAAAAAAASSSSSS
jgi:hypothetical protein